MHKLSHCSLVASWSAEAPPAAPRPAPSASQTTPPETVPEAAPPQAPEAAPGLPHVQRRRALWVLHDTPLSPFR